MVAKVQESSGSEEVAKAQESSGSEEVAKAQESSGSEEVAKAQESSGSKDRDSKGPGIFWKQGSRQQRPRNLLEARIEIAKVQESSESEEVAKVQESSGSKDRGSKGPGILWKRGSRQQRFKSLLEARR